MTRAQGPECSGKCGKRVSATRIPRCLRCGRVLCMKCRCPGRCFEPAERDCAACGHGERRHEGGEDCRGDGRRRCACACAEFAATLPGSAPTKRER